MKKARAGLTVVPAARRLRMRRPLMSRSCITAMRVYGRHPQNLRAATVPMENRIRIKATKIASVTIDPAAARVDCNVKLDIDSDGPLKVRLLGCAGDGA